MSLQYVSAYAKACHDDWKGLIGHEGQNMGLVCVTIVSNVLM